MAGCKIWADTVMTTSWRWHIAIIVPLASRDAADEMADFVAGVQPSPTFTIPLSPTGQDPVTHYGCATHATDEWLLAMQQVLPSVTGVRYWRSNGDGVLVASTSTNRIGEAWSWQKSLDDATLTLLHESPSPVS